MSPKNAKSEIEIAVKLEEPLTSGSCSKLAIELIKYLLYQKQQVPFSYECLTQLQAKAKPTDKNFSSIKAVLNTLENVSEHLTLQLQREDCNIKEIVVVIGATIVSPKFCVRVEISPKILSNRNHMDCQHSSRKPLVNLMKSMIACSEFQEAVASPLGPTNTFILLHKSDSNVISEFFLPKPQYAPPVRVPMSFRIKFQLSESFKTSCNCMALVKIYHESSREHVIERLTLQSKESLESDAYHSTMAPYQWYQSREIIKGFKFIR
ncbi:MAD2L1-binding protein [Orussus abietinus]|uniref:MAD2L1-binding protein n=1 Tax=Orussus abietinus TaxID=222816 RepID=UPI000625F5DE|nr:MAD2L1-binding protein [Orussus abietinus]